MIIRLMTFLLIIILDIYTSLLEIDMEKITKGYTRA